MPADSSYIDSDTQRTRIPASRYRRRNPLKLPEKPFHAILLTWGVSGLVEGLVWGGVGSVHWGARAK